MAASESKREAIEVAARPLRDLLREEHDEIAAAQRALRQAEKAHNRAIELAQRQLRAARTAKPLASYGHEVILYADRVSTAAGNHELTPAVTAWIEERPGAGRFHRHELTLKIEGPTWRRDVTFPRGMSARWAAGRRSSPPRATSKAIRGAARADAEQADRDLGGAWADRRAVEEIRALIHGSANWSTREDVIDWRRGSARVTMAYSWPPTGGSSSSRCDGRSPSRTSRCPRWA